VEDKIAEAAQAFAAVPGISVELAQTLVESGFHALEDLTQVEASDLVDIEGIGDEAAAILEAVKQELNKRDNRLLDPSPEDPSPEDPSPEDPSPEDNADA
jgi:transcription termination factor NusA